MWWVILLLSLHSVELKTTTELYEEGFDPGIKSCAANQFECPDGQCIPKNWLCDSQWDCEDGSDEPSDCLLLQRCRHEQFQCSLTKQCIPMGWVCDEEPDCGTSLDLGLDTSDEDPKHCNKTVKCPWNHANCPETFQCLPISKFCDGKFDCPGNSDEWDFCTKYQKDCKNLKCSYECRATPEGAMCYCPEGQQLEGGKCVDADECELEDVCPQLCQNTHGSYTCSCVTGYVKNGTDCIALNVPQSEPPSLIFSTHTEIKRVTLEGKSWPGNSTMRLINSNALEFVHRNHTLCYVHHNLTKAALMCANINDLNSKWELQVLSPILDPDSVQQIAFDWVSNNWYFLDNQRELIMVCSNDLKWCNMIIDYDLSKPRALALDPTNGYLFFTKWGHSPPMVERARMTGKERKSIINHKIVYPYGVTVDFPNKEVYWVDTYMDYVERSDYDGKNRKTVIRGINAQNLYGITVFENKLFVSSWHGNHLEEINRLKGDSRVIVGNISRPFNVAVFHRQRQPEVAHPCKTPKTCDHLCIPIWKYNLAQKQCICASGYLLENNKCVLKTPPTFLILSKSRPFSIKGVDLSSGNDTIVPITKVIRPKAIEFDSANNTIIFTDYQSLNIQIAPVNDTSNSFHLLEDTECDGLAFDWVSRNLYFTSVAKGSIGVVKLSNSSIIKTLMQGSSFSPTSIVVAPVDGIMFWADWSSTSPVQGRIDTAFMDGSGRRVLLNQSVHWPTGLTIDAKAKRLYWCDKHSWKIESVGFDGSGRRSEVTADVENPVSLTRTVNGTLLYIDFAKGQVMSYRNDTGLRSFYKSSPYLYDVKVFSKDLQNGSNLCSKSSCPELCLPTPKQAVCACSDGYKYDVPSNTCSKVKDYVAPSYCPSDTFQCTYKKNCIPNSYLCDGADNCGDGSDENSGPGGPCFNLTCGSNQMKCDNTTCIAKHWICDGEEDCSDGTDEDPNLCVKNCTSTQFRCQLSKRCIPKGWLCDFENDCGPVDLSDEADCDFRCKMSEFTCKSDGCIPISAICDGEADCADGSDEVNCSLCTERGQIFCEPLNSCLPGTARCDGQNQCPDGSDEDGCGKKICEENEFACATFECIPKTHVCDSDLDCVDGSDEVNCDPTKFHNSTLCPPPNIPCDHHTKCLQPYQICDNRHDCQDSSDESNCPNQTTTSKPPTSLNCDYPHRLCDNGTKCITTEQLCNSKPDCEDGSDENGRCDDQLCKHSYICSHGCHNAPEGLICSCPSNLHLQGDKSTCLETHPCEAWGICSQTCFPRGSKYKCTCLPGYVIQEDSFTCKSTDPGKPFVIFSNRHELRGVDLQVFGFKSLISGLKNTIALDFFHSKEGDIVFWTDVIDDKIYKGTVVGGSLGNIEVVVQTGLSTAEGLAVDWIGENLYWVESNLDQIEVAKLNGSFRRTLVAGDMESPRAIALDPRDGVLFWTDWDNILPRIESCSLAGLSRQVVVKVNEIGNGGWPNGLTLDYALRRIYWIDARSDSIHTTKYDGTDHHEVMSNHELLSHPFAISLYENHVYWTDWRTNSVVRANKFTGGDVTTVQRTLTQPFDIKIMHPSRQPKDINPCGLNNGGCSHLCLLHVNKTFRCDCPHVMRLSENNKTCIVNERVLLIARHEEIRGVDILQPYYHTIPSISVPQVLTPVQIDYLAANKSLYWADVTEVKRSGLTSGRTQTLIDTGVGSLSGIVIDWRSKIMFVSSKSSITAYNLEGEYATSLVEGIHVISITGDVLNGRLYFIEKRPDKDEADIKTCLMDGTNITVLVQGLKSNAKSLVLDYQRKRLYWVNDFAVFNCKLDGTDVTEVALASNSSITVLTLYQDHIYYANDNNHSLHIADKITGERDQILRSGTVGVLALKIYDPREQVGSLHVCGSGSGCQHLCLPKSSTEFTCKCATGYYENGKTCIGYEEFILYSLSYELQGLSLNGSNETRVLGPISRVFSASTIDFLAEEDMILWADADKGTITSIKRDGTDRKFILEVGEAMDVLVDWLTGLSVDWIGRNVFWGDSKRGVIEVARLDGTFRHVLITDVGKVTSLVVDPIRGYLIWASSTKLELARMDGTDRKVLVNGSIAISDLVLDSMDLTVYFCDSSSNTIERVRYDGTDHVVLLNHTLENPVGLSLLDNKLYWVDTTYKGGSICMASTSSMGNFTVLKTDLTDVIKDLQIFSKRRQKGTNPCAKNNNRCQQLCLYNGTQGVCVCSHGKLGKDNKSCEPYDAFIVYSRVAIIDSIQMNNDKALQNSPNPVIKNSTLLKNAIGLSFSFKYQRIFYSDIQKGSINTVFFNGTDHKIIVERQGSVEGLAYEQIGNALYWTCHNDATINRVNLTGSMTNNSRVETIIRLRSQDRPRGIAVDSCGSRVYWTNWNSQVPSIERAFFTGYDKEAIITTRIRMPNAIALDHKAQKMYWGDARLDKIERCEYDGTKRVILAALTAQHPFAIAVYGDFIYWTDWILHAVVRADKFTGQQVLYLRKDLAKPMGIVAVANDTEDCFNNPCLRMNGGCQDICSLSASGSVQCSCTNGQSLGEDGRCFSKTLSKCSDNNDSFRCSDGGCVPFHLTCDSIPHCSDGSDEEPGYCNSRKCPLDWFQCSNKRCILEGEKCNGIDNCGDSSDEIDCDCSKMEFRCNNGKCIEKVLRCDNDPDCLDNSDEIGCVKPDCVSVHGEGFVNCEFTTACIHKAWICDGHDDCWDNSDEKNCTVNICKKGQFKCKNGACIDGSLRCNGHNDCDEQALDGVTSDEVHCAKSCPPFHFTCTNSSTCLPDSLLCNGSPDCPDSSDETNCPHNPTIRCPSDQFQCEDTTCIPKNWQCDGNPDCPDKSDESQHCSHTQCLDTEFRCNATGSCIPKTWLCDGEADCLDRADELQNCPSKDCLSGQFRCSNGKCISQVFFCDGDRDCSDASDEPPTCHQPCSPGEFKCSNGKCILDVRKCDQIVDCEDNSDELDCPNTLCTAEGLYKCQNGVCINATLLCDGENNCGDFSDEELCNINECSADPPPCHQLCQDKPVGFSCSCKPGFRLTSNSTHCEDIDECLLKPCSQLCENNFGSYHCSCAPNYYLTHNEHSCKANSTTKLTIILANRYYIRELDLRGHSTLLAHNLTNAVALDYDYSSSCIYWSDVTQLGSSIKRLCDYKHNTTSMELLHGVTLQNPDGIAVDWIARNLYWCDKGLDTIEVSTLGGKYRKVLIGKGLEEPRAIALDPKHKNLFWTDWGIKVHIGKAGMDGSNPKVIITEKLGWPNALTILYETNELYWADAQKDYIAVSDLDGKNVQILLSREQNHIKLHHVFAIDIWEDYIYWSDWETKTIERCNKFNRTDCSTVLTTIHRPMDIRIVHPLRQPAEDNPCETANCSTLCLLSPNPPYYKCSCPENYILEANNTCTANCSSNHFECENSLKCIPYWWKCDTQDDCGDGSDEPSDCRPFKCMPGQYQCNNSACIHPSQLCNGKDDCGDKSDETNCEHYACLSSQFRCEGNSTVPPICISNKQRCNKIVDCPLGQDEQDCPPVTCPPGQFRCANEKCIPAVWVCDNDNDCTDNSDEMENCGSRTCSSNHFRCNSGRCIPNTWKCDSDPDCSEGEDEPPSCSHPDYHTCESSYFKCNNNKCIPGRWRCDYESDCGDNSDELNCVPRNCSESEFRCNNGKCIRGSMQCDGEYQCEDKSDEFNCTIQCKNNEFRCSSPQICIYLEWRCDGEADCADGSDELNCSESCSPSSFQCGDGLCINKEWKCDGQKDCLDGSDELNCSRIDCPKNKHRCNGLCLNPTELCDGLKDCADGSDENPAVCRKFNICPKEFFKCKNGRCIDQSLVCDGYNDCDSDESDCDSACKWNTCSQLCVESKKNKTVCKCVEGFRHELGGCKAEGQAQLLLAAEAELRIISPYKSFEGNKVKKTLATAPGYKLDSIDVLQGKRQAQAFFTDHHNKRVQSLIIHVEEDNRANRDADVPKTILANLVDPRGISLDWISLKIYITDAQSLLVSDLEGTKRFTLINTDLNQPRDIVVAPKEGLMFWADWGPSPRIETAYMDGYKRKILVRYNILWPSSLAIDHPASRLYWSDPKTLKIETVKLDGTDRQIVKTFTKDQRPFRIEVFEDFLYASVYLKHDIIRLHKFGSNITYLAQGLTRVSDLLILHESKHLTSNNSCDDYCHPSEFCLLTPHGATCTCADGYVKSNLTCTLLNNHNPCPLRCNTGTCKVVQGQGPTCFCPPQYTGKYCDQYRCSQYCKNHGNCYVDLQARPNPDSLAPLRCICPPQWTGDRCETPVNLCDQRCLNGGTCFISKPGVPQCKCPEGFSGSRCQNCLNLTCQNEAICSLRDNKETCICPAGYRGKYCEISSCGKNGKPVATPNGSIRCSCAPGFTGEKCTEDSCYKYCLNGGTCKPGKQPECICTGLYSGKRCELDLCQGVSPPEQCKERCDCKNFGTCLVLRGKPLCKCPESWGGANCEVYLGNYNPCSNYCENSGVCQVSSVEKKPVCFCSDKWTGDRCKEPAACSMHCYNGGTCAVTDDVAYCQCPKGYEGTRCETPAVGEQEAQNDDDDDDGGVLVPTLVTVATLVLVLLIGFFGFDYYLKRKQTFSHERLQENDFNNPIYHDRDAEPFTLDADKSGNFENPVYDSVYNGGSGSGKEEKAVLLEHPADEAAPASTEEL